MAIVQQLKISLIVLLTVMTLRQIASDGLSNPAVTIGTIVGAVAVYWIIKGLYKLFKWIAGKYKKKNTPHDTD